MKRKRLASYNVSTPCTFIKTSRGGTCLFFSAKAWKILQCSGLSELEFFLTFFLNLCLFLCIKLPKEWYSLRRDTPPRLDQTRPYLTVRSNKLTRVNMIDFLIKFEAAMLFLRLFAVNVKSFVVVMIWEAIIVTSFFLFCFFFCPKERGEARDIREGLELLIKVLRTLHILNDFCRQN